MRKEIIAIVGLLSFPVLGFTQEPVEVKPPQQKILSSYNGRYVVGEISNSRKDQFLLDTKTGRLWQIVVGEEGNRKLQPVPFIPVWAEEAYIPDPKTEIEGHRELLLKKREEDLRKMFDSQSQGGERSGNSP